jgi:S1-C subfamily serine protease
VNDLLRRARSPVLAALVVVLCSASPARAAEEVAPDGEISRRVENAVVQVFATQVAPDPVRPWSKEAPREITGSGVVIEGRRILTNAHLVLYASQVEVQASRSGDKLSAKVKAIAPGIDLALLELDDPTFFDTHAPLPRASALPSIRDSVLAYGFPTGGSTLSITKGIVSRIEFVPYKFFFVSGLRIQVDAAINPGNSGGPAVAGDRMVGLVFSNLGGAQNIGYIIPCEEIELFLADVSDGTYDGKPALHDEMQTLESDALRSFLKLEPGVQGIVVHAVDSADPKYPLKEWDVVTSIGDVPIDNQGRVEISGGLRVGFRYLVQKLARDGKVPLTIRRGAQKLTVQVPVVTRRRTLLGDLQGSYPSYFVFGPVVFSPVTFELVGVMGAKGPKGSSAAGWVGSPAVTRMLDPPSFPGEELVAISSPLFPHKLSKGYSNPMGRVVTAVNGTPVKNLLHLVGLLRECRDDHVVLTTAGHFGEGLVFPCKEAAAATEGILASNGVRAQGSPDAMAVWNGSRASR